MKETAAILDIGSRSLVTLIGENGVNGTFNISGKGEITYAGFQNAEFLEPANLKYAIASSISNAETTADAKITEIYIGVPSEFCSCVIKNISLEFPKAKRISKFDIDSIFKIGNNFENEPYYKPINSSVVYYVLDGERRVIDPMNMKSKKITGQISYILAMKSFITTMKAIFSDLKIEIKGFISAALAESLYLFDPDVRDKYVLLVDIGYITTSVSVSRGNALIYLSSFSMGGGYVTSDLMQCLKISFAEALRLRRKVVLGWNASQEDTYDIEGDEYMKTYSAKATNEIVSDRLDMICDYIQKCLDNCMYDLPDFLPMFVTGGGVCNISGVCNMMIKKFKRQVIPVSTRNLQNTMPYNTSEEGMLNVILNMQDELDSLIIR